MVKVCKKHGVLTIDQVKLKYNKKLICKLCESEFNKKYHIVNKQKLREKAIKLRELLKKGQFKKICMIHGELKSCDIYIDIKAKSICKICISLKRKDFYIKNKLLQPLSEKFIKGQLKKIGSCIKHGENVRNAHGSCRKCSNISSANWKKRNPEKAKHFTETMLAKSRLPERIEYRKNREKVRRKELTDYYVKSILKNKRDMIIPKELIDLKRVVIQIKREIKNIKENA